MALNWTVDHMPNQTGRTVVVTGATSGLGRVTAARLAEAGATVLMAVRDTAKGERVRAEMRGDVEVHRIDLADPGSIRMFAESLGHRRIDALINNAGLSARERELTPEGYERVIATNHLGPFALTGLLLNRFRPDRLPRVVTVGSNFYRQVRSGTDDENLAATGSFQPLRQYVRSKVSNLLFAQELDRRLRAAGSPVRSFAAHPGMAWTGMQDNPGSIAERVLVAALGALVARSAEAGALPILFAATDPRARADAFHGPSQRKWDKRVHFAPVVAPCNDSERAARQWAIAEAATGVHYLSGVHL
ncbi:SDR family NAD(P)-dependent oxidoreductase [Micromonospora echinospora]|uniref:SDR family NAD(P)-dependent oxidoreductase n=1 Tax=Micromonospora echinospora TaxID=1877 RepID=UPI00340FBC1C